MDGERQVTLTLTYTEVMELVGLCTWWNNMLNDMAKQAPTQEQAKPLAGKALHAVELSVKLLKQSETK